MKFFFSLFLVTFSFFVSAQTDSIATALPQRVIIKTPNKPKRTPIIKDTTIAVIAATQDSLVTKHIIDSIALAKANDSIALKNKKDTTVYKLFEAFPLLNNNKPAFMITSFKEASTKDALFYLLIGIVLLLALIRIVFPKYLKNVFSIFFQTSFRQKQTKEQLTQDNIAALLLNILFIICNNNSP